MGHNKNKKHMVEAGWPLIGLNKKHKELVEKVLSMGYMADQVINSIQRLEGSGQPLEFNVVPDQLNEPSSRGGSRKLWWIPQAFQKSFVQVQSILDHNRLLINEINQNHESKIPDNLSRNVSLIRELNNNIKGWFLSMLISPPLSSMPLLLLLLPLKVNPATTRELGQESKKRRQKKKG